ncbi:hypothetical protein WUBG_10982, partial [Wuchereria bancrofti]
AEVRAIRDKRTCVEVGDLVISVDNRLISSLRSAEEVQILLRHGKNLVLRKRDAIVSQYIKSTTQTCGSSSSSTAITTTNTTTATTTVTTTFDTFAPPPPPPPQSFTRNRSHSMDRISDITSYTNITSFRFHYNSSANN